MSKTPLTVGLMAAMLGLGGCSIPTKPTYPQPADTAPPTQVPENSAFTKDFDPGEAPRDLVRYESDEAGLHSGKDSLEKQAVREAGRRLGATAGYNHQAELLYKEIEAYDPYLDKIFNFQQLLLPDGVTPPVLAKTERVMSYEDGQSKTIRARVFKTVKHAEFANPRAPSWRDYLNLNQTGVEYPLPQLQEAIDKHYGVWTQAVQDGWERGHHQARQAFEIAINELSRDYEGMQLFRMLWMAGMVEPPKIVDATSNVDGGGQGRDEMSVGVRRIVISENAYFVNDASEWNALIAEATAPQEDAKAGLSDLISRQDNTDSVPDAILDNNLNRYQR